MKAHGKLRILQEPLHDAVEPRSIADFDVESIDAPTYPLFHQTARFLYFLSGEGTIRINDTPYEIKPHTLVSITPWVISEVSEVHAPLSYYILKYAFPLFVRNATGLFQRPAHAASLAEQLTGMPVSYRQDALLSTFQKCGALYFDGADPKYFPPRDVFDPLMFSYLLEIAIYHVHATVLTANATQGRTEEMILSFIYANSHRKLSLTELSSRFFMSESSISRYIRDTTGLSFFELLNEMRVAKAVDLLLHTDMVHDEIAELLGYADASHFCKLFVEKMGISPKLYRANFRPEEQVDEARADVSIVEYILENSAQDLTLYTLAQKFSLSTYEVNRRLKILVGKTFQEYLHYVRINKAIVRMLRTNQSLTDIAFEVGYNTVKTFQRNFFKQKHMLPTEFRTWATLQKEDIQ